MHLRRWWVGGDRGLRWIFRQTGAQAQMTVRGLGSTLPRGVLETNRMCVVSQGVTCTTAVLGRRQGILLFDGRWHCNPVWFYLVGPPEAGTASSESRCEIPAAVLQMALLGEHAEPHRARTRCAIEDVELIVEYDVFPARGTGS